MMMFGTSTVIDLLSWIVALTLGLKLVATLILLRVDRRIWDRPGWGAVLWWSTKVTPLIAAPCAIGIAILTHRTAEMWVFVALLLFVLIAVPFKIRQRRIRIAARAGGIEVYDRIA